MQALFPYLHLWVISCALLLDPPHYDYVCFSLTPGRRLTKRN